MDIICEDKAIIQPLNPDWYACKVAAVDMLRLDLVHPVISGNKWYKLQHNLQAAKEQGANKIITFGGAYSNHLVAAAAAAQAAGLSSVGIVRGLYAQHAPTATLQACSDMGMQLVYISTADYARKTDAQFLAELQATYGPAYMIPEGGANEAGRLGAGDMTALIPAGYTHICLPVGTGTSLIGLRNTISADVSILGFAPFKNGEYLRDEITSYIDTAANSNWNLYTQWHFGGFGKWDTTLIEFMNEFYMQNNIPLDILYNAKMMYGLKVMLSNDVFGPDARILCVHTGGLQGNSSIQKHVVF